MVDAFVIGAGPSGLLMASELIRHGLTCRLIDKAPLPSDKSKAIAVQARTLEVLNYVGITDDCIAQGLKIVRFIPTIRAKKLADISFKLIKSPYPFILSLEQSKFETILIQHLKKQACKVEREVELLSLQQTDQNVQLSLRHNLTGETESCETKWLIGCDGAHSTVRKQLDFAFEGISLPQIFSLVDLELEWKYPRDCFMGFLEEKGTLFVAPLQEKNRNRIIFQLERDLDLLRGEQNLKHEEISSTILQKPTLEEVSQLIHQYADPNAIVKNPIWMTNFNINSRMVNRYRKNRVFLVGDAAHIHSPVGGQGMNTGLQDAFNLAWKLALVHRGIAKESLLDSYHDERHFVGKKLLKGTKRATSFILTRSPFLFFLRNALLSFLTSFSIIRSKIASTIAQINICYPPNQWIVQKSHRNLKSKAGMRASNASILTQEGKSSLFCLWKVTTSFHLLLIDLHDRLPNLDNRAKTLETRYGAHVKVHIVRSNPTEQERHIQDLQGEIKTLYGDLTTYLIRPDGYISYCAPLSHFKPLDEYLNHLFIV